MLQNNQNKLKNQFALKFAYVPTIGIILLNKNMSILVCNSRKNLRVVFVNVYFN